MLRERNDFDQKNALIGTVALVIRLAQKLWKLVLSGEYQVNVGQVHCIVVIDSA